MPEPTPTGAVDVVERQVRRVRRRKNLYELQRTLYLAIAAAAVTATILLPLALFAPADLFAIAAWSALAILVGLALVLVGASRRRWLARGRAAAWIESQRPLGGRVRTLLELASRPASTTFFHALLASQVGAGLDGWKPSRLVPRRVPRGPLLSAALALAVLFVVFHLASLAMPAAPAIGPNDGPLVAERGEHPAPPGVGERMVMAPGVPGRGTTERAAPAADVARHDDSTLTELSSALQESVRQQVWGNAWERVRDALARAGTGSAASRDDAQGEEIDVEGSDQWDVANAPSDDRTRPRRPGARAAQDPSDEASGHESGGDQAIANAKNGTNDESGDGEGGAGAGAGNGTSPDDLFAGTAVDPAAGNGSFELSLAARMRADRAGPGQPKGPAPAADPDARPALASEQRRETAAHRMAVPAAYEHVVREVFAHREAP
jgi:hypothetical protein